MRFLIVILFIIPIQIVLGQGVQDSIVKSGITKSKEDSFYFENDKHGNMTFSINEGMNGAITMIFASEYDSLNRETKSYWVHSNLGYYLSEKDYEKGSIKNYNYKTKTDSSYPFDRETLHKIKTREDFIQMKVFQELESGNKSLSSIKYLDSAKNVHKEIYISENGDTTSINYYKYNSKNQQILFHYGTIGSEFWTWDIYYLYDEKNNKVKSFRISSSNGIKDTTEVYNYLYDQEKNILISSNYYYKNTFRNRTDYFYNKNNQIIKELFYERSESKADVKTVYKYDKRGNVNVKTQFDYRNPKKNQKEVFETTFEYW